MAERTNQLRVRLVTPERTLFESLARLRSSCPRRPGYMEVLYGHAPLLAELGAGDVIRARRPPATADADSRYNVSWGFVEVLPDRVTILANDALKPEEIDVPRAEQQLDRGRKSGEKPAKAKRPTTRPCASSPKPKPKLPPPGRSTERISPASAPLRADPVSKGKALPLRAGPFPLSL